MQYIEAQAAAERAVASMAMRALLAREAADRPEVTGLTFRVTFDEPGLTVVECDVIGLEGRAIEGLTL